MANWEMWKTVQKKINPETDEMMEFVEKGDDVRKVIWKYQSGRKYWHPLPDTIVKRNYSKRPKREESNP